MEPIEGNPAVDAEIKEQLWEERGTTRAYKARMNALHKYLTQ